MNKKEFKNFFNPYSKNVDKANSLAFWKLSDDIIIGIIRKYIPVSLRKSQTILDAGGGTGRWICDLSKIYKSNFILYDLSEDMLDMATKNIKKSAIVPRVKIVRGDLTNMKQIPTESVDYVISIYSPISFIYKKEKATKELWRVLKKGGVLLIMGHGFYNALASKINNYMAPVTEIHSMNKESMVKWGKHVPKLNIFSQEQMEGILTGAGFTIIKTYGIPVFIQPGAEDFNPSNSKKSKISKALENPSFYKKVYETEMRYNGLPEVANRGMNIFTVAKK